MFFSGWSGIGRVLLVGTLAYVALVVLLRVSGKRTLSKLNAFDLVVTVALGSTLATILLSKEVALAEGVTAFALLIFLQYLVAWGSVRSQTFSDTVKSQPTLLFYRGEFLHDVMRRERLTEAELRAAIRETSYASLEDVEAVVLETTATISVLGHSKSGPDDLLCGVRRPNATSQESES